MNNLSLKGKTALVFYPDFFDYGHKISNAMKSQGMHTYLYNSRPVQSAWGKAFFKVVPEMVLNASKDYYQNILDTHKSENIDYIFIVERLPIWFLKQIKEDHPTSKMVLYMDDSIRNLKGIEKRFPLFDKIYSFDKQDANEHDNIEFRPLFYCVKEERKEKKYKYDLCFIGTSHSDRYKIVKKIKKQMDPNLFFAYLYLQSDFMFTFYKLTNKDFKNATRDEFSFEKMKYEQNIQIEDASKVILDIQHPNQTGLTMRTIEMIGLKKKIMTTNSDIQNYDFYRPENIMIIDRNNPVIDPSFFDKPYKELEEEIYEKYSIEYWVHDVLK